MNVAIDPSWAFWNWSAQAWALMSPYLVLVLAAAGRELYRRLRRPVLSLSAPHVRETKVWIETKVAVAMGGEPGTSLQYEVSEDAAWGRLLVSNASRRRPAMGAHVVLVAYELIAPPDRAERLEIRMPLTWSYIQPQSSVATLHGGSPRYLDVVAIFQSDPTARLQTCPLAMRPTGWLELRPRAGEPAAPTPATWRLQLEVVAESVPPRRYELDVSWVGIWDEPPVNDALTISNLRKVRRFATSNDRR